MSVGKRLDHLDDDAAFARRYACRRLVEQQNLGIERERDGDLDQALAAVGEFTDRPQSLLAEAQPLDQREGLVDRGAVMAGRAEQPAADPLSLANRQGHVFEHAEAAKQRGDLKGAHQAALDPRRLPQMR